MKERWGFFISSHHIYMQCNLDLSQGSGWNGKRGSWQNNHWERLLLSLSLSGIPSDNSIKRVLQIASLNTPGSSWKDTLMHEISKKRFTVSPSRPRKTSSRVVHQEWRKLQTSFLWNSFADFLYQIFLHIQHIFA